MLIGVNKGDPKNSCTKASGVMVVLQTATLSYAVASSCSLGAPRSVAARASSISDTVGDVMLRTMSHSGLTSTVAGSITGWTSQAKASILPSSGVDCAKYKVTYCTPQRTWMRISGVARQMRSRGLSFRGKVEISSRRNLDDLPCLLLRGVNRYVKVLRLGSSLAEPPSAVRVSGT